MKPPPFSYHDPQTTADVIGLLGRLENARLLAGGQSLMPMLNMRFVLPDHLIDLNGVEGLAGIRETEGLLAIGAMTRQRDLEFSAVVREACPLMHEAIGHIGHRQTRNRGPWAGRSASSTRRRSWCRSPRRSMRSSRSPVPKAGARSRSRAFPRPT
jgi:carbon-monoxide dehydrogenase medium subunit